ncbi:MAG: hypothetical protein AB1521_12055 [Bacteroidota bacterium]
MKNNKLLTLIFTFLIIITVLLIHFFNIEPVKTYTYTYIFSSFIFLIFSLYLQKKELNNKELFLIISIVLLAKLSFLNTDPIGSEDIYRYIWDGKLQANGINPYRYIPTDSAMSHLHSALLPAKVNFPGLKTIYFPFSEWLFYISYKISGEAVWGFKLILLLFEIFTILFILLLLRQLKKEKKYILLYLLCPLTIFQFSIDAHLDGLGITLLAAALYFHFSGKKFASLVLLGISLSIKPIGVLFLPILFIEQKKIFDKISIIVLPFLIFGIQFIPYIFTSNPFEALFIYTANWSFNGFIFKLIYILIQNNQTTRLVCSLLLIIALITLYLSKKETLPKFYFATLLLFIFSPVVHTWYIGWIVLLASTTNYKSGIMLAALSSLTSVTIYNYILHGVWRDYWPVLIIEYLPVMFFMIIELFFRDKKNYSIIQQQ